jgi:diguanylate cyclase (GGDEF)-like protein
VALAASIAVIGYRYFLHPSAFSATPQSGGGLRVFDFLYQSGKLLHFALLATGTAVYVGSPVARRRLLMLVPLGVLYALISVLLTDRLNAVVMWQAPVASALLAFAAVRIGSLPPSRNGLGSQLCAGVLAIMSVLWLLYFFAFGAVAGAGGSDTIFVEFLVRYNAWIDIFMAMLLGLGMVVVLMEDVKREVDDANAELGVAHNNLRRAALYDTVTGSLNRRAFAEGVGLEMARAGYGAVMMFDLDDLKRINDTYGHSAGDALLCHLTDALRAELRPSDKLYRWGGDEFLLVLPGADEARANARIREILGRSAVLHLGPERDELRLAVSMGSAPYTSAEQLQSAIDLADAMMYREKNRKKQAELERGAVR